MNASHASHNMQTLIDSKRPSPSSDVEKFTDCLPPTAESNPEISEITYPEGGRDAWLVVLGAWCGLTASMGIYNSAGVFEVVVSEVLLPEEKSSTLGWIFSIYAFVNWVCGAQVGPTFDAMGPRALLIAGTVCTLIGIFSLSACIGKMLLPNMGQRKKIISIWSGS